MGPVAGIEDPPGMGGRRSNLYQHRPTVPREAAYARMMKFL